jgi:hypothetical protein
VSGLSGGGGKLGPGCNPGDGISGEWLSGVGTSVVAVFGASGAGTTGVGSGAAAGGAGFGSGFKSGFSCSTD